MVVKRIVVDVSAQSVDETSSFYSALFDLHTVMDQGWIVTLSSGETAPVQISIARHGGSGTPTPNMSIEVDDVDSVHARAKQMNAHIEYDLTNEPWGVRRFFVRDPVGNLLNVLSHIK